MAAERWKVRWRAMRRDGVGSVWRAGLAYALHDHVAGQRRLPTADLGRWLGGRLHPTVLETAEPGRTPGWELDVVLPPTRFSVEAARAWYDTGQGIADALVQEPIPAQTLGVRRLRVAEATIQPGHSLIVTQGHALVPEFLDRLEWPSGECDPGDAACLSAWRNRGNPYRLNAQDRQRSRECTVTAWTAGDAIESLPRAISLCDSWDSQFGHGVLDLLPRLEAITDLDPTWPILVSDHMPRNVQTWIRAIAPERHLINRSSAAVIHIQDLIVPLERARLWHDPSRFPDASPLPATIDPAGMLWLQQRASRSSAGRRRRVWIRRNRSPHSNLEGEESLVEVARGWGFTPVYLEDLTLGEAMSLFAETSDVIAPMGSAVANLALASPGVKVLQLTDHLTILDRLGSLTWLRQLGHESALLIGQPASHGCYRISPRALADAWGRLSGETMAT